MLNTVASTPSFTLYAIIRQLTDRVPLFFKYTGYVIKLSWCLVTCRHFEKNSDRLFRKCFFLVEMFLQWNTICQLPDDRVKHETRSSGKYI